MTAQLSQRCINLQTASGLLTLISKTASCMPEAFAKLQPGYSPAASSNGFAFDSCRRQCNRLVAESEQSACTVITAAACSPVGCSVRTDASQLMVHKPWHRQHTHILRCPRSGSVVASLVCRNLQVKAFSARNRQAAISPCMAAAQQNGVHAGTNGEASPSSLQEEPSQASDIGSLPSTDYRTAAPNLELLNVHDGLSKRNCLLFFYPEAEPLARAVAATSSSIELGRISWRYAQASKLGIVLSLPFVAEKERCLIDLCRISE